MVGQEIVGRSGVCSITTVAGLPGLALRAISSEDSLNKACEHLPDKACLQRRRGEFELHWQRAPLDATIWQACRSLAEAITPIARPLSGAASADSRLVSRRTLVVPRRQHGSAGHGRGWRGRSENQASARPSPPAAHSIEEAGWLARSTAGPSRPVICARRATRLRVTIAAVG